MAAEAMLQAETDLVTAVDDALDAEMRQRLNTLVDDKVHDRQNRFFWLREQEPHVAPASLAEILEKVALRQGIEPAPVAGITVPIRVPIPSRWHAQLSGKSRR